MSSSNKLPVLSPLDHAILALVGIRDRSGYDLMKVFSETPFSVVSNSTGAIYPALKRLEKSGLLLSRVINSDSLRSRKEFRLTAQGRSSLLEWLRAPVDPTDVRRRPRLPLLRFSFLDQFLEPEEVNQFLRQYLDELLAYRNELKDYIKFASQKLSQTGVLAVDLAIEELNTRIRWTRRVSISLSDTRSSQKQSLGAGNGAAAAPVPVGKKEDR